MVTVKVGEGKTKLIAVVPNKLNDQLRLKCKKQGDLSKHVVAALTKYLQEQ